MAPVTPPATGLTAFLSSATKTQLVIFYAGLSILCASVFALVVYAIVKIVNIPRRLRRDGKWRGWKGYIFQAARTEKPAALRRIQVQPSVASPPAWALAYKNHFEANTTDCFQVPVSPYGMPMLRTPNSRTRADLPVEKTPALSPRFSEPEEQASIDTPRQDDSRSSSPHIVVDCDNAAHRTSFQDTIFPVFPALTAQKSVIDYLSIPPPHCSSPVVLQDDFGGASLGGDSAVSC